MGAEGDLAGPVGRLTDLMAADVSCLTDARNYG